MDEKGPELTWDGGGTKLRWGVGPWALRHDALSPHVGPALWSPQWQPQGE